MGPGCGWQGQDLRDGALCERHAALEGGGAAGEDLSQGGRNHHLQRQVQADQVRSQSR